MAEHQHIDRETLRLLVEGAEVQGLAAELYLKERVFSCFSCRRVFSKALGEIWGPEDFDRKLRNLLSKIDLPRRKELLRHLLSLSHEARVVEIASHPARYAQVELIEGLIEEVRSRVRYEPQEALEVADLSVMLSLQLPPDPERPEAAQRTLSRAMAHRANVLRVCDEQGRADNLLKPLVGGLEESNDTRMEAEILDLLASLRTDQRRLSEAMELLGRAITIYENLGESHLAGRSMLSQSLVLLYMGRPEEALTVLDQAASRVHAEDDLHLKIAIHHNQALALCDLEDFQGAKRILHEHHDLYEEPGEENLLLRRRWLEGKILAGLKSVSEAVEIFVSVRRRFLRRGDGYDAAMVSLDLALLHLKAGQYQEVKRLSEEMTPVFRSQEVHREAMAALMLFQEAARREEATIDLVRRLALYLGRVRGRPGIPFSPEA